MLSQRKCRIFAKSRWLGEERTRLEGFVSRLLITMSMTLVDAVDAEILLSSVYEMPLLSLTWDVEESGLCM